MAREARVVLVSMPWASLAEPSLGVSLLDSVLAERGIYSRARHFAVRLLRYLRPDTYQLVADVYALNDYVFGALIDPVHCDARSQAVSNICEELWHHGRGWRPRFDSPDDIRALFEKIRYEVAPKFVQECADEILRDEPTLVGFTCLYDQTVASLAVAKEIKSRRPDIMIAMGGYALHGEVGDQVRSTFAFVDEVVQGPGEQAIVELALRSVRVDVEKEVPDRLENTPGLVQRKCSPCPA